MRASKEPLPPLVHGDQQTQTRAYPPRSTHRSGASHMNHAARRI